MDKSTNTNRPNQRKPDPQPTDGQRLTPSQFQNAQSSPRKLYTYSRNLGERAVALPPVSGEDKSRRGAFNKYEDNERDYAIERFLRQQQRYETMDQAAQTRGKADWMEERRRRVENAMKRVEQSYVGELRYGNDVMAANSRPEYADVMETKKPAALVPIRQGSSVHVEVSEVRKLADDPSVDLYDRSLLIPSSTSKSTDRTLEEELELDRMREVLLEKKIREANEFKRKQKKAALKSVKDEQVHASSASLDQSQMPCPPSWTNMPAAPSRDNRYGAACPVPPIPQAPCKENVESYSKRKRKLKPFVGAGVINMAKTTAEDWQTPDDVRASYSRHEEAMSAEMAAARVVKNGVAFDVDTKSFERSSDASSNAKGHPKPPLIPRQASFNIWNGETAKRGLGFKSKLRKEMEEASLRSLERKEDENRLPQVPQKHDHSRKFMRQKF